MTVGVARTLRRLRIAAAVVAVVAVVALGAAARGADRPAAAPAKKAPPTADYVRLEAGGGRFTGFCLLPDAEPGYALLEDDGRIRILPRSPAPKIVESSPRPVTEIPSPALVAGLAREEAALRDRCEELLLAQGEAAIAALRDAMAHESAGVRRRVLSILVEQAPRHEKAVRPLLGRVRTLLTDADERVRELALRAYAALGADDVRERCEESLEHDESVYVRHEAILQLGRTADARSVDPLLAHLEDCEERSLRIVTFDALRRLTRKSFGRDEIRWRAWWANHRHEFVPEER